jgi:hypothetical protein
MEKINKKSCNYKKKKLKNILYTNYYDISWKQLNFLIF